MVHQLLLDTFHNRDFDSFQHLMKYDDR